MSQTVLDEHLRYWQDSVKVDRYRRALAEVVRPGDRVLDLGSGTGLLGLLACEAGAGHVIAVESGPLATVAEEVFERNGVADRVRVIRARSTELVLPEPVDVIVGDQIGGFAYGAGTFEFYADAAERFLSPTGVTVPARFDLLLAAAEHQPSRTAVDGFRDDPSGYDLSPLDELISNTIRLLYLDSSDDLLSEPKTVRSVSATDASRFRIATEIELERAGRVDGLVGMFTAELSPSVTMSNVPGHTDHMTERWQDLFPLAEPIDVRRGDRLAVELTVNPATYLATWRVGRGDLDGAPRHSSFYSRLLGPEVLRQLTHRPTPLTEVGRKVAMVIAGWEDDLVDTAAVVERLVAELPHVPRARLERMVRSVTAALARADGEAD